MGVKITNSNLTRFGSIRKFRPKRFDKIDPRLLVCGTNAFNPKCRYYSKSDGLKSGQLRIEKEFSGKGFCPYDPSHNSTSIFTGESAD
jgi:hypothetical protein